MNGHDKPRKTQNGYWGRLQETGAGHTLLWADGFIQIDTLPQDQ